MSPPPPPSRADRAIAAETAAQTAVSTGTALPVPPPRAARVSRRLSRSASLSALVRQTWAATSGTICVDADEAAERVRRACLRHLDRGCGAEIGVAVGPTETAAALRLAHDIYVREGYMEPHPLGMRILLPYHALKTTTVLVARLEGEIVGTLSLMFDSPAGLPMDELYTEALGEARRSGRRLVELSNFAIADCARDGAILLHLMRAALRLAMAERCDDLVIAIHPKHEPFYRTIWLMERFGDLSSYQGVRGAPAIGLRGDLNVMTDLLGFFYGWLPRDCNLFSFVFDLPESEACR